MDYRIPTQEELRGLHASISALENLVGSLRRDNERLEEALREAKQLAVTNTSLRINAQRNEAAAWMKMEALQHELEKAKKFKEYVHKRLDDAGIPPYPNGPHTAEGCRVGDRLDYTFAIVLDGKKLLKIAEDSVLHYRAENARLAMEKEYAESLPYRKPGFMERYTVPRRLKIVLQPKRMEERFQELDAAEKARG